MLIRVVAKIATEINPFLYSVHTRNELTLEDVLELHLLYSRIERPIINVEGGRDTTLVLSRQYHLTTLSEIFTILYRYIGSGHLHSTAEGVGETKYPAVTLGCWELERCGLLSILIEERVSTLYLYLCIGLKVVGLALL